MDGRTVLGKIEQVCGGVGRNLADALGKLYRQPPILLSAVGPDIYGRFLLDNMKHFNRTGVEIKEGSRSACYTLLIDREGETRFGVGDMEIHNTVDQQQVTKYLNDMKKSSMLILDGNIPENTINFVIEVASKNNIPVWYEPTDISKANKPMKTNLWQNLSFITPNLAELKEMARYLGKELSNDYNLDNRDELLKQIKYLVSPLVKEISVVMVTMGKNGALLASHVDENEPVLNSLRKNVDKVYFRYYEPVEVSQIQNTSGAGDCTASGFISGVLFGLTEPECMKISLEAGMDSLQSKKPVPDQFSKHSKTSKWIPKFFEV